MSTFRDDAATELERKVAELERKLQAGLAERDDLLLQRAATAEILKVINGSPGDLAPVFDVILEKATLLCAAGFSALAIYNGDDMHQVVALRGAPPALAGMLQGPIHLGPETGLGRLVRGERFVHIVDAADDEGYRLGNPVRRALVDVAGARSYLAVPIHRDGVMLGSFTIYRREVRPFSAELIALLQSFADQAAIAIQNARLFDETQQALARQTATSDILRIISQSPTDVQPVFQAIVLTAARLLGCDRSFILRCDGATYTGAASAGPDGPSRVMEPTAVRIDPDANFPSRAILSRKNLHLPDWSAIDLPDYERRVREAAGINSALYLPLLRADECIGLLGFASKRANGFSESDIALAESFRDQALIAIENARLFNETQEALERQTATADILSVIASSPSEVQPVFDAIVANADRLVGGFSTGVYRFVGAICHLEAFTPVNPAADEMLRARFPRPFAGIALFERAHAGETVEIADTETGTDLQLREIGRARGFRSVLYSPLMSKGAAIGVIVVSRSHPGAFSAHHVELLRAFADQAVIAIENVRLFRETQQALERQTATADILKVIASSPSNVQPVFDAIAERSNRLVQGLSTTVQSLVDDTLHIMAFTRTTPEADAALQASFPRPLAAFPWGERIRRGEIVHTSDVEVEWAKFPALKEVARLRGFRSMMFVPLLRDGTVIGIISVTHAAPGLFAAHHVELLRTFADQAVIAIENVRLFDEVQAKTRDLTESLQQQTATADVLKVISRSAFNLQAVLDTLVVSASKLCDADRACIFQKQGEVYRWVSNFGFSPELIAYADEHPFSPGTQSTTSRVALEGVPIHNPDVLADPNYKASEYQRLGNYRTMLGIPLLREGVPIGVFILTREQVRPFSDRQIELVTSFADQAVIAIENVRLFDEVQARTSDLAESLQQQTATADVLKVISRSAFDLETVLVTLTESATSLCESASGVIYRRVGNVYRYAASTMELDSAYREYEQRTDIEAGRGTLIGRMALEGRVVQIADAWNDPEYREQESARMGDGVRAMLGVPLIQHGEPIGAFALGRKDPIPFTQRQVDLVTTFADQAVIAIENARLFDEVQARTKELAASLDDLRTAQDRLVQTEKLASLGQLTAGIAHEIKNPLNFVNNFSALSAELTDELNDLLKSAALTEKMREEVDELTGLLKDNLVKVVQHGKRADSIVKNMLLHSREGAGEHRPADINALLEESLNLAYHGARAEKSGFNITLQRDFDAAAGEIELFPQEITRAFLNLISNGFYAASKRQNENGNADFEPILRASTKNLGHAVEIRIRDNGTGIPPEVKEKMFNPFFTTKPAGEGTGLGLSMSHDIIVKQHGGRIDVLTEPGQFTEFTIVLPRTSHLSKNG